MSKFGPWNFWVDALTVPALIFLATVALVLFFRPRWPAGLALTGAGLLLALVSSAALRGFIAVSLLAWYITWGNGPVADVPGEPSANRAEVHYRLDVIIEVDGRPITGSVVQAYTLERTGGDGVVIAHSRARVFGQALVMDLPEGRPSLLVPMSMKERTDGTSGAGESAYTKLFRRVCRPQLPLLKDLGANIRALNKFTGTCEVTEGVLPLLLSISNKDDPNTILLVDSTNLSLSFGEGVEFIRATITTTNDPVTDEIDNQLPWVKDRSKWAGFFKDPNSIRVPNPLRLLPNAFFRGVS